MSCPMCGKETKMDVRPFCSRRCANLDLARWFNGSYAVPSTQLEDTDDLEQQLAQAANDQKRPDKPH
ncbi:DNA gyrase inhibitor YacG [Roseobacter sp.]|uniref:DNA gyrase inhibitor YacG n=1 Tax=Roseobacter sp. TaxID=1907202 RepID=UPI00385EFF1C